MDWSSDTLEVYALSTNSPKAIAVIIYIEDGHYGRADFKLSKKLWKKLDCEVRGFRNPTRQHLDLIFHRLNVEINANPKIHSYLSLVFIGHGGMNQGYEYLQLFNNTRCYLNELYDMLSTSNFPGLAGKPKLIFLQVCRGPTEEVPAEIYMPAAAVTFRSQWYDLFILHSSFMGHVSYYGLISGESPFIQAICEVFEQNFQNLDILRMATLVKNKVSGQTFNGYSQTVTTQETLTKTFYFVGVRGDLPVFIRTSVIPHTQTSGSASNFKFKALSSNTFSLSSDLNVNAGTSTMNSESGTKLLSSKSGFIHNLKSEELQKRDMRDFFKDQLNKRSAPETLTLNNDSDSDSTNCNDESLASSSYHGRSFTYSNDKSSKLNINAGASTSYNNDFGESISNSNIEPLNLDSNSPPTSSNDYIGPLTSYCFSGETSSHYSTGTGNLYIECDTCGTTSNTPRESRKPWSRGRLYYPCHNQGCEQHFIVWAGGEELRIYLRAKHKKQNCYCSYLAKRSITKRGSNKGIPYYHCRLRDCTFWSWEKDVANS